MSYIGLAPGVSSQRMEDTFTATAGQTSFVPSSGYVPGNIDVYRNGVKLANGLEFTASDGITVVLNNACAAGDSVVLLSYIPRGLSDGYTKPEADSRYFAQSSSMGFRNRIINGDMRIDQRNNGASVTPTDNQYTVDRWAARLTQAAKYSVQQNAGSVTPPAGFRNYLGVTSLTSYPITSGDTFDIQQRIEGFNAADLGWGTAGAAAVTLSFWVRSSLTGTFGGVLQNSAFNRSYPYSYTISAANTWEQKTVTIAGDTTGTWLTTNGTGVVVSFGLGNGSVYSGTAGAWVGAGLLNVTGATSVVGTNGATFYITGVQLEKGSVATPFEFRSVGQELALCQRYYEKSYSLDTAPGTNTAVGFIAVGTPFSAVSNSAGYYVGARYLVTKRAAPTVTIYSRPGTAGRISTGLSHGTELAANSAVAVDIGENGFSILNNSGGTATISQNALAFHYAASAEL